MSKIHPISSNYNGSPFIQFQSVRSFSIALYRQNVRNVFGSYPGQREQRETLKVFWEKAQHAKLLENILKLREEQIAKLNKVKNELMSWFVVTDQDLQRPSRARIRTHATRNGHFPSRIAVDNYISEMEISKTEIERLSAWYEKLKAEPLK